MLTITAFTVFVLLIAAVFAAAFAHYPLFHR